MEEEEEKAGTMAQKDDPTKIGFSDYHLIIDRDPVLPRP